MNTHRRARLWFALSLAFAFLPVAALHRSWMFDIVNAMTVAVGISIVIAYFPALCKIWKAPVWLSQHYLVMGIYITWLSTTVRHILNWVWRFRDKPPAMIDHPLVALIVWVTFVGGLYHLTAKGAIDGEIPRGALLRLGAVIGLGISLALMVIVFFEPTIHSPLDR